jgi:hypothetical protein
MTVASIEHHHKMSPVRIAIAIILAIVLLTTAGILYSNSRSNTAQSRPATNGSPHNSHNTPPGNSVTQGGNPADDTTPNPNGTGNNTTLNQ